MKATPGRWRLEFPCRKRLGWTWEIWNGESHSFGVGRCYKTEGEARNAIQILLLALAKGEFEMTGRWKP